MKYGVIDIGTNSMRLLIATVEKDVLVDKHKWLFPTRMGEGLGMDKVLSPNVIQRNLEALGQAKYLCDHHGVERIIAFGTSALRDATNRDVFLREAKKKTGVSVEVLGGEKESELGFLGIMGSMDEENMLILDVGGGSSEWVLVRHGIKQDAGSIDVGAVRMKEAFLVQDPPSQQELDALRCYIDQAFSREWEGLDLTGLTAVGIGGTATTMSAMHQQMATYQPERIQNSEVGTADMERMLVDLCARSLEQRKNVSGLQPTRADVIIPGMLIVMSALKVANIERLKVSDSDNLEGAIYDKIKRDNV